MITAQEQDMLADWLRANPQHNRGKAPFTLLDAVENSNSHGLEVARDLYRRMHVCEFCKRDVDIDDEWFEFEAAECETCHDKRTAAEEAYWRPLYDGEVLAGLHRRDGE